MTTILLVVLIVAGIGGALSWFLEERRLGFAWRGGRATGLRVPATEAYRVLENCRQQLFEGSRRVRLTLFAPDNTDPAQLRPVIRLGWGEPSWSSNTRFQLGEGLAGKAWECALRDAAGQGRVGLAAHLGPFKDVEEARRVSQQLFDLRPETARRLSTAQLQARVLVATTLVDAHGRFRGVLCIDTLGREPALARQNSDAFWQQLSEMTDSLTLLIEPRQPPAALGTPLVQRRQIQMVEPGSSLSEVRVSVAGA